MKKTELLRILDMTIEGFVCESFLFHMNGAVCWVSRDCRVMVGATPNWERGRGIAVQVDEDGDVLEDDAFQDIHVDTSMLLAEDYAALIAPLLARAKSLFPTSTPQ